MTKERPILMSGPMARACLDDSKTETRRVIKPQPKGLPKGAYCDPYNHNYEHFTFWLPDNRMILSAGGNVKNTAHWRCPYGVPGDKLWVRESWAKAVTHKDHPDDNYVGCNQALIVYKADGAALSYIMDTCDDYPTLCGKPRQRFDMPKRWRPSIHMPRWASRILLEIVELRAERLQDVTEAGAMAEGIRRELVVVGSNCNGGRHCEEVEYSYYYSGCPDGFETAVDAYAHLWDAINGKGAWADNPWVWVVKFKRIKP